MVRAKAKAAGAGSVNNRKVGNAAQGSASKPVAATLMEANEQATGAAQPKRSRKRGLGESLQKAISDNSPAFSQLETDLTLVNGMPLLETIADAKQRQKDGDNVQIGKLFYTRLREEFGSASDVGRQMVVEYASQPEDPRLKDALMAMLRHNRDASQITQWLRNNPLASQKNFVGMCRAFLMVPPCSPSPTAPWCWSFSAMPLVPVP